MRLETVRAPDVKTGARSVYWAEFHTGREAGRAMEINRELVHVQHQLAELNPKWEEQATRLAALE